MKDLGLTHAKLTKVYDRWGNRYHKVWMLPYDVSNGCAEENARVVCPVCGKHTFEFEFALCPVCGWQNDLLQAKNVDLYGGANKMSVNQAREAYFKGEKVI